MAEERDALAQTFALERVEYRLNPRGPVPRRDEVETQEHAVEVAVYWGDNHLLHVDHLTPLRDYYVGEREGVDFVIGRDGLGVSRLPLCITRGDFVFAVIPEEATAHVELGGESKLWSETLPDGVPLERLVEPAAVLLPLPAGATVRVRHRAFTFVVSNVRAGKKGAGRERIDHRPFAYTGGSAVFAGLILGLFYLTPPRPRGLSADIIQVDSDLVDILTQANELRPKRTAMIRTHGFGAPAWTALAGEEGLAGTDTATDSPGAMSARGPSEPRQIPHGDLKKLAQQVGILAELGRLVPGARTPTSPFNPTDALGADAQSSWATIGRRFTDAPGLFGLGLRNRGRGGGGTAAGTIPVGTFRTGPGGPGNGHIGPGGAGGPDGPAVDGTCPGCSLAGPVSRAPQIRNADAEVIGALSKETIRREVRRHLSEVRHCYEQGLQLREDLAGTIEMRFVIGPSGAVQSAKVAHSTLKSPAVEACIGGAVRRWSFPQPSNGGVVVVNYPFRLTSAGH